MPISYAKEGTPRRARRWACAGTVAALLASAIDAGAADPGAAKAAQDAARLMTQGKVAEACALFAESQRLDPKPATLAALARCQQKAGQLGAALASYRALAAGKPSGEQAGAALAIKTLEKKLPRLLISVGAAAGSQDLVVARDGVAVDRTDWNHPVPVDPGTHAVTVSARGKKPWTATVVVPPSAAAVTTLAVPALQDDVSAVSAQGTDAEPLKRIGGATWSDGVGFVVPEGQAPAAAEAPRVAPTLPVMVDDDLSHVALSFDTGVALVTNLYPDTTSLGVRGELAVRAEFRHRSSYVAPWFDVVAPAGYFPDGKSGLFGGSAHVGVDVHPLRLPWIGVGPFVGYGIVVFRNPSDMEADHGPDIGLFNVHFRTKESEGHPPLFDADVHLIERLSLREHDKATYGGLRLGVGGSVRLRAFAEYRLASDEVAVLGLAQRLYAGIGIGGAE